MTTLLAVAPPAAPMRSYRQLVSPIATAVDQVGAGVHDEQFDAFYQESFARLTTTIYAMIGNLEEAQDVVQEAFIRAWDRRGQLDASRSDGLGPEAWVRTVAYRLAVSRWRRARKALHLHAHSEVGTPTEINEPQVHHVALVAALKQLPATQRRCIVLYHLADMSVEQVAAETGQPTGTVKAQLSRGRSALRGLLAELDAPADAAPAPGQSGPQRFDTSTSGVATQGNSYPGNISGGHHD